MADNHLLWYLRPADTWEEALPIGAGRIGAMVFGHPEHETIQLNEDSIWNGGPMNRINSEARENLEQVRKLILENHISEAEELLQLAFAGTPHCMRSYQPLGWLRLNMRSKGVLPADRFRPDSYSKIADIPRKKGAEVINYRRELSLSEGIQRVHYVQEGIEYRREIFASYPDQIIAVNLTATEKGAISFSCRLERDNCLDWSGKVAKHTVMIRGGQGISGIRFCGAVSVSIAGGTAKITGEQIVVDNADSATIFIAAGTTYYYGENYIRRVMEQLEKAEKKGYERLKKDHVKDYRNLYDRMSLSLSDVESDNPTDVRLENLHNFDSDNGLFELYFNFARYLLISSSRPGSLPANLQGIWNDKMQPKWDSKFTININTEMNYWPAERCGLSECHLPLFDLIRQMQKNGHEVADKMYGCRGFVAHHNTDIWGDCAPQDRWPSATYWVMGGAWLCLHIWKHYEYTLNREWLQSVYDLVRESVVFFEDFLIEKDGEYLICPSTSPENTYIMPNYTEGRVTASSTMDNTILRELLECYLKMSQILDVWDDTTEMAEKIISKLRGIQIGKYGQIMEWREDYEEIEPGHRHISQLYGLYPGHEISFLKTPELAKAAEVTLERRLKNGGGHTGWSCAWIIAYYARLHRGNDAFVYLKHLLQHSTCISLLDTHPLNPSGQIFQIDGNLGAAAAIMEMIVQTEEDQIILLPALPDNWKKGEVKGICLPGAITLGVIWEEKIPVSVSITAKEDTVRQILFQEQVWTVKLEENKMKTIMIKEAMGF